MLIEIIYGASLVLNLFSFLTVHKMTTSVSQRYIYFTLTRTQYLYLPAFFFLPSNNDNTDTTTDLL